MTLEEAIKHCENVAEENETDFRLCPNQECNGSEDCSCLKHGSGKGCLKCATEHRQLAKWLKELKELREQNSPVSVSGTSDLIRRQERSNKWRVINKFEDCCYAKCSQCNVTQVFYYNKPLTNFCPNCGAKMESEEK